MGKQPTTGEPAKYFIFCCFLTTSHSSFYFLRDFLIFAYLMFLHTFSGPGGEALGKTRSGREFSAYGSPLLSGTSSGSGENGDLGVEAGNFGDFGFVSPAPA